MANLPRFQTKKVKTSNFNLSHKLRTTLSAGTCIVGDVQYGVPGQKFKITPNISLKTLQTLAPVMGSFAVQVDFFWSNLSNYVPAMRQNNLGFDAFDMTQDEDIILPSLSLYPIKSTKADRESISNSAQLWSSPLYLHRTYRTDRSEFGEHIAESWYNIPSTGDGAYRRTDLSRSSDGTDTWEVAHVSPSSLWSYLDYGAGFTHCGSPVGFSSSVENSPLAGLQFLTYWDIIRNYYANPQEPNIPCYGIGQDLYENEIIDNPNSVSYYQSATPNSYVSLSRLDEFFSAFNARGLSDPVDVGYYWRKYVQAGSDFMGSSNAFAGWSAQELYDHFSGLAVRTYFPDYFTARLNTTKVDQFIRKSKVAVDNGSFTIETFRFANRTSQMLNLSLFSGGRFDDWQRAQWSVKPRHDITIPEFIGSMTLDISFDEIVSLSGSETGDNPAGTGLGAVAGRVDDGKQGRSHYFETDTYGCLMTIISVVPRVGYSNGRSRFAMKNRLSEYYLPAFDRIGFQATSRQEMTALPELSMMLDISSDNVRNFTISVSDSMTEDQTIGTQVAYTEYETRTDRIKGQFAEDLGNSPYWTIQPNTLDYRLSLFVPSTDITQLVEQSYTPVTFKSGLQTALDSLASDTTLSASVLSDWQWSSYVDPQAVNALFPDQSRTAENLYLQVYFDIKTNMPKSKEDLPML